MGGGNAYRMPIISPEQGLSPRGRGKPSPVRKRRAKRRSIPAWAGETHRHRPSTAPCAVYPRVGGGNRHAAQRHPRCAGLSPRGRGKHSDELAVPIAPRSIPAWAGETITPIASSVAKTVYPRVGGGNPATARYTSIVVGLSPRGRGKPIAAANPRRVARSIPAWAGETLTAAEQDVS